MNKSLIKISIFFSGVAILAQTIQIPSEFYLAAGATKSLPKVWIKNSTGKVIRVDEVKIQLKDSDGIHWRSPGKIDDVSYSHYEHKLSYKHEFGDWFTFETDIILKYLGFYRFWWRNGWTEKKSINLAKENISVRDNLLVIKLTKRNAIVVHPNEALILNQLPIETDLNFSGDMVNMDVTMYLSGRAIRAPQKLHKRISSINLSARFNVAGYKDHLGFIGLGEGYRNKRSWNQHLPGNFTIECLGSKNVLEAGTDVSIRLLGNNRKIWWQHPEKVIVENDQDKEIDFNRTKYKQNRPAVFKIELVDDIKHDLLRFRNLKTRIEVQDPFIATIPLEITIMGENRHTFIAVQTLQFGNPKFVETSSPITLFPGQSRVELPTIIIAEDSLGAAITSKKDIFLHLTAAGQEKLSSVHWDGLMRTIQMSGSAGSKVDPIITASNDFTIKLDVLRDFNPGDILTISGLRVETGFSALDIAYYLEASFDGGKNYSAKYPQPIKLYKPSIDLATNQKARFLYRGKPKSAPNIVIKNEGNQALFKQADVIRIAFERDNLGLQWNRNNEIMEVLAGEESIKDVVLISANEIAITIEKPLLKGEEIILGNLNLYSFNRSGSTRLILFYPRAANPIALSAKTKTIDVRTPEIGSLCEQQILPNQTRQYMKGIQIGRYEQLGLDKNGVLLRLPKDIGIEWDRSRLSDLNLHEGQRKLTLSVEYISPQEINIKPNSLTKSTLYLHQLPILTTSVGRAVVDTGRIQYSLNRGYSFSNVDKEMIRLIDSADPVSPTMSNMETIKSNFPMGSNVELFLWSEENEHQKLIRGGKRNQMGQFELSQRCTLRYGSKYNDPVVLKVEDISRNSIRISPAGLLTQPKQFADITNVTVKGIEEVLRRTYLAFVVHNYSGYDTIKTNLPLLQDQVTDLRSSSNQTRQWPSLKVRVKAFKPSSYGDNAKVTIERIQITNGTLSSHETSIVKNLRDENIRNVQTLIKQGDYSAAQKMISNIKRVSRHYWRGYWLEHWLNAENYEIEDATAALTLASRYGWIPSNQYPKHLELSGDPLERARAHYSGAQDYYYHGNMWEADSVLNYIYKNYIVTTALTDLPGGQDLERQVYELLAESSRKFMDYSSAANYYNSVSFISDDPERLDSLANLSYEMADSIAAPYTGPKPDVRIEPIYFRTDMTLNPRNIGFFQFTASGLTAYPLKLNDDKILMQEIVPIQGGRSYTLKAHLVREDFKRLGVSVFTVGTFVGLVYYYTTVQ